LIDSQDAHAGSVLIIVHSPILVSERLAENRSHGLMYLSSHLFVLSNQEEYRHELYELLCEPFMREKQRAPVRILPFLAMWHMLLQQREKRSRGFGSVGADWNAVYQIERNKLIAQ